MKKTLFLTICIVLPVSIFAQVIMLRDPVIMGAVKDISVENMEKTIIDMVAFHTRHNLSTQTDPAKGIGAAADYLYNRVAAYIPSSSGRLSVDKVFYDAGGEGTRLGRAIKLCNIVATIKGSDPSDDRVIIALAHYDSRSFDNTDGTTYAPGANDNGSGVACLMEMVRIISTINTPVTVKLIFLSGEEHGLLGAQHMANLAKEENWNIIGVLNNDMIGNSNASQTNTQTNCVIRVFSENIPASETDVQRRVRVFNSFENDSPSRQFARYIKEIGERYVDNMLVQLIYRNDRFGRGGDHTPFCRNGFTAVRICEVNENYDRTHQEIFEKDGIKYGDEIWAVDFEYVRKNTGINLATILNLAFAPDMPQNVIVSISGLSNTSVISWNPPANGKSAKGYYLLIRETDQSMWQKKIIVYDTKIEVPYSKDNYLFAVQSIDEKGHESIAAMAYGK